MLKQAWDRLARPSGIRAIMPGLWVGAGVPQATAQQIAPPRPSTTRPGGRARPVRRLRKVHQRAGGELGEDGEASHDGHVVGTAPDRWSSQ